MGFLYVLGIWLVLNSSLRTGDTDAMLSQGIEPEDEEVYWKGQQEQVVLDFSGWEEVTWEKSPLTSAWCLKSLFSNPPQTLVDAKGEEADAWASCCRLHIRAPRESDWICIGRMESIPVTVSLEVRVPIQARNKTQDPFKWRLCHYLDDTPMRSVLLEYVNLEEICLGE